MFNPISLEIFNNLFSAICEEMGVVLCKSSFSTNIKERRDFSCALFDGRGEMVAQAEHLPVHLASMSLSVKEAIKAVEMRDGDTVILNDPFQGGTHLPDITVVTPFFYKSRKEPVFYVANRAHHSDVGGMSPGSMCNNATEIYQEGVRIPPVKIVQASIINKDIMSIITSNVRTPEEREWDIVAQISANTIGKQGLWELCDKYGKSEVIKYSAELQDYSDRIMRSVIRKIPDGEYSFSDFLDDDGIVEKPVRIKQYHMRQQSGGTGKFRGGHGIVRDFEFLDTASVSILSDRRKFPPYGLKSGKKGQVGQNILISKGEKHNLPSKVTVNVKKGDIISICTPGGGGYGRCEAKLRVKS